MSPKLSNRLKRFIHTGNELPKYYPGCWTSHKYFEPAKLPVIDEILDNDASNVEVINIILQVYLLISYSI